MLAPVTVTVAAASFRPADASSFIGFPLGSGKEVDSP
jgi:hypothetical protein